jgi:hypothetical protein
MRSVGSSLLTALALGRLAALVLATVLAMLGCAGSGASGRCPGAAQVTGLRAWAQFAAPTGTASRR